MRINDYIDHTFLKPEGYKKEVKKLVEEALENEFYGICVNPAYVKYARDLISNGKVKIVTVVGFPLGSNASKVKAYETKIALEDGADEIDMVINYGALIAGDYDYVKEDIMAVRNACDKTLKVILETCMLSDDQIIKACEICDSANVDFVKTSTGFSTAGSNVHVVEIMKNNFSKEVKASGGVRSIEDSNKMIEAGATRLGTSSGVKIINSEISEEAY